MSESNYDFSRNVRLLPKYCLSTKREKRRVWQARRRARRRGLSPTLTLTQWIQILYDHNWRCVFCGHTAESLEHVTPLWAGGNTTPQNCVPACINCNNLREHVAQGVHHLNKAIPLLANGSANDLFAMLNQPIEAILQGVAHVS